MTGLSFEPGPHSYTLDGIIIPSVTAILRESGLINFDGIPIAILEAARQRGSAVHQAIHYYNEQDLDVDQFVETFPGYAGYLQSWMRLVDSGRLETVLCEHRVASRRYQFAGTIDWLGTFDGRAAILDFYTGGDPEDAGKHLQTVGYLLAAREWANESPDTFVRAADRARHLTLCAFLDQHKFIERYSVRLKKTGELPSFERYDDPRHAREFLALVEAQRVVRAYKPEAVTWREWDDVQVSAHHGSR